MLSVILESEKPHLTLEGELSITYRVTYEKANNAAEDKKAIMFHTWVFHTWAFHYGYTLYRQEADRVRKPCETDDSHVTEFIMVDSSDERIKFVQDKDCVCLVPGESWTAQKPIQQPNYTHIPDDSVVGDKFKYLFKGTTVEWWT